MSDKMLDVVVLAAFAFTAFVAGIYAYCYFRKSKPKKYR
jgi:hypothetical protein